MPHVVILYTGQLDAETDMTQLCRGLAATMLTVRDEADKAVFPSGGVRVFAYPAPHYAVADGGVAGREKAPHRGGASGDAGDYAFVYLNLRMGRGRSDAVQKAAGEALMATTRAHLAPLMETRHIGVTLQIDVGPEVFDAKMSNLHPLFGIAPPKKDL